MKIMSISLRHRGHRVLEATSPEQGLLLAGRERPDVILMDLMFHDASFDGIEAIRRLKADPRTRSIPVVAHTASVLDFTELAVMEAGAAAFLRKPFRRRELLVLIEQSVMAQPAGFECRPAACANPTLRIR